MIDSRGLPMETLVCQECGSSIVPALVGDMISVECPCGFSREWLHKCKPYITGKNCPECGTAQSSSDTQNPGMCINRDGTPFIGTKHSSVFSCSHFEAELLNPKCVFCGKPGEVKQVPAHVPTSECYCNSAECYEKCKKRYEDIEKRAGRRFVVSQAENDDKYLHDIVVAAVAGGWCHEKNKDKVMDPDLAGVIIDNVMGLFADFTNEELLWRLSNTRKRQKSKEADENQRP